MQCTHRHVVIHRDEVERHDIQEGLEAGCSCGPGLICPVCDWETLYNEGFIVAPAGIVDAHLVSPPEGQIN